MFIKTHILWGITSTYVENTAMILKVSAVFKDHLHIRGEYPAQTFVSLPLLGSPPHTWRIHGSIKEVQGYQGITSTYVENTEQ